MKKTVYLGSPIKKMLVAITDGFSFADYEDVIVYLHTNNSKTIKMSLVPKDGYLPLILHSDTEIIVQLEGKDTKSMGVGEITFELYVVNDDKMKNVIGVTNMGIELSNNKIKAEV